MAYYEGRRFSRVEITAPVAVELYQEDSIQAEIHDISVGGISVRTKKMLPLGSECGLRLSTSEGEEIEARGTILRVVDVGLAIELTGIRADTFGHLVALMLEHAEHPGVIEAEVADRISLLPELY